MPAAVEEHRRRSLARIASSQKGDHMTVHELIASHPHPTSIDRDTLLRCIDDCFECAASCTSCADACLAEPDVQELVHCIRMCLDCADICDTTGRTLTRQTTPEARVLRVTIEACATTCRACAEECDRHAAHHEHCRLCAETCRRCEQSCNDLLATIG
jgi:hypothetical protein